MSTKPTIHIKQFEGDPSYADKSTLEKCLHQAIQNIGLEVENRAMDFPEPTRVTIALISCEKFSGYLVVCNSTNTYDPDLIAKIYRNLSLQMEREGQILLPLVEPIILDFKPQVLSSLIPHCTEFATLKKNKVQTLLISFVKVSNLPLTYDTDNPDFFASDTERALFPDSNLGFDLHLFFQKNNKILLYLKKETPLVSEAFQKLNLYKIKRFYFKRDEKDLFNIYQAENRVIEKIKLKKTGE